MASASKLDNVYTKQQRIAELAKQSPEMGFTSLAYFIDIDWLHEAYQRTRKDGAVGVDGQTAVEYEQNLEANLQSLLDRAKSGTYQAPLVRIPAGTIGARCVGDVLEADDGQRRRHGLGGGHPKIFRQFGSWPLATVSPASGA